VGFMDKVRSAVDQHGDKIAGGIDKAAATADRRTKGKYSDHIRKGTDKGKEALDKLDGKNDGDLGGTGRPNR
jgi:MT0933-like antitoxin protein